MPLKLFIVVLLLFRFLLGNAQDPIIKVIDAENSQTIPNAHVCAESASNDELYYWVTNTQGFVKNKVQKKSQVAISFIGYHTLIDSITPGKSYTFKLSPKTNDLSEVVVTGQIKPETADKSIYNVQVINNLQIKNKAANNLAGLLSNELNIRVQNNGVLGASISMQGLTGEHIKILIDGVPVIGRQNGNIDLNQLNLQNVDHIEIIEGPMSVVYGSNALAGAINIITKKNTRPKLSAGINGYAESVGVYNTNAFITKNIHQHYLNVTGGRNLFDGYRMADSVRTFDFDPKIQYFGTFDYGFNGNNLELLLTQDAFKEKLITYGSVNYDKEPYNDTLTFPIATDENHITLRTNSKASLNYSFKKNAKIEVLAAYSYYNKAKTTDRINLNTFDKKVVADTSRNDTSKFYGYMSRGNFSMWWDKLELLSGYDVNMEHGSGKRILETKSISEYAAFVNLKYSPMEALSLQGGARLIENSKYEAPVVYSLNAKWQPIDKLNIRASYGKGFRSPSLKELYLQFEDINHNVKGNPNLEAEFSENYNLSANYKTEKGKHRVNYSLKLYHNRINNKIDFAFDSIDATKADYININGTYKTIGGQFDVNYRFHPRFKFTAGVNYYGNSKLALLNEYTYTPDIVSSANYHNLKYNFRINLYWKRNGKKSQFINTSEDGEDVIKEQFLASYNMMDITISRPFFEDRLDVALGVKNLFNNKRIDGNGGVSSAPHSGGGQNQSSIAWGRTVFAKLSFNINNY